MRSVFVPLTTKKTCPEKGNKSGEGPGTQVLWGMAEETGLEKRKLRGDISLSTTTSMDCISTVQYINVYFLQTSNILKSADGESCPITWVNDEDIGPRPTLLGGYQTVLGCYQLDSNHPLSPVIQTILNPCKCAVLLRTIPNKKGVDDDFKSLAEVTTSVISYCMQSTQKNRYYCSEFYSFH